MAFQGCKVLPNISMHAVDMSFQSRDLRDKSGTFLCHDFLSRLIDVLCVYFQLAAKLSNQIVKKGVLVSYLLNALVIKTSERWSLLATFPGQDW